MSLANYLGNDLANDLANRLGGGRTLSPAQILGSNLRFRLDARTAWSAAAWVDTVGGLSLAGTGTPTRAADGANFRGVPVATFNGTSQAYDTGPLVLSDIVPAASRPYTYLVGRHISAAGVGSKLFITTDALDALEEQIGLGDNGGSNTSPRILAFNLNGFAVGSPHFFEVFLDASGVRSYFVDGASVQVVGVATQTTQPMRRVGIGGRDNSSTWCACAVAEFGIATAVPSAANRAALLAYARATWNTP